MSWNSGFESRVEFISSTPNAIHVLKTDVRTRCDRDHDFYLDGAGEHADELFESKHFKPGLFVQRLGDVGLDQEFEFSDAIASIIVPGLRNSTYLPAGVDTYGFLHMKIEGLESVGAIVRATSANQNTRNGGDDTLWRDDWQIRGLASYNGLSAENTAIYPEDYVTGPDLRFYIIFGKQEMRYGHGILGGQADLIQSVRYVVKGHYIDSGFCPRLYMSLTIQGVEVIAPTMVAFTLTPTTIYGPWVDVSSNAWTFEDDINDVADSYLTVDGRHYGTSGNLNLTVARLELRTGAIEFQDYHASLVDFNTGELITSSQPQNTWNKDWFWLPLDVIDASALGGISLTSIKLYKDNHTEVNGKITVKELILYGR